MTVIRHAPPGGNASTSGRDELNDLRSLALPGQAALTRLADALTAKSADQFTGWRDVVIFIACTASCAGEVSGCRVGDIDP